MVEVNIADLQGEDKEGLGTYLQSKLPVKMTRKGDTLTFEDKSERTHVRGPEIKTYLKRYMHMHDLKNEYRLLSDEGSLRFAKRPKHEIEANQESEEEGEGK